jgi:long-chain fatty acid transport protein
VLVALAFISLSEQGYATNGYFPHGIGAKNKAMAGAGMAMPEEAISIVSNPAAAVFLQDRIDVGLSVFMPKRNYSTFFGGNNGQNNSFSFDTVDIDSSEDLFLLPEMAGIHQLENDSAFAWAFYTRGGIGGRYPGGSATFDPDADGPLGIATFPGTYGDGTMSLELTQGLVDLTWARKAGDKLSFGFSAVLAAQSLKAAGFGGLSRYTEVFSRSNGAELPGKLSGNGKQVNYGAGLKLGLHWLLADTVSAAVMYQTRINVGRYTDYADLLAERGDLDMPSWFKLGVSWRPVSQLSFSVDIQQISYSQIDAWGNSFANVYECPGTGLGGTKPTHCLGGKSGAGFGWNDVPVYSFGASWDVNNNWTLRAGMSIGDQPVVYYENTFNIPIFNLTEAHYTAGVSRRLHNGDEWSLALMYAEEDSLEAVNQLDSSQIVQMTTDQFDIQLSYSWKR